MLRHAYLLLIPCVFVFAREGVAQPSVKQALSLVPMQADVQYDRPTEESLPECSIHAVKTNDQRAWIVKDGNGNLLRRFVDTNGDNKIDLWCYYKNAIEVYRDIDGNFNERADEYRWFGTGGMRWGLDRNEDGTIDEWKWISPEEVSAELVRAIREKDPQRFAALLATPEEIAHLGLKADFASEVTARIKAARAGFAEHAAAQRSVTSDTRWIDFSAPSPGVVPAGSDQSDNDLIVYENVIAVTDTSGTHGEIQVGTLVKVGHGWRIIDLPSAENTGFFFSVAHRRPVGSTPATPGVDPKIQQFVERLEDLDRQLANANSPPAIRRVYQGRTAVLRELIKVTSGEDRNLWLMQLVDSVVATAEPGSGNAGVKALSDLMAEVESLTEDQEIRAQAKFALMTAEYTHSLQQPKADYAKIQDDWIDRLEAFVNQYEGTRPAGEAMLQLAVSQEFAGEDRDATTWYTKIIRSFPRSEIAEKAAGAKRRLQSVGKPLELQGQGLTGRPVDLAAMRGRVVLIHYWATWCEPCKQDMKQIRRLLGLYASRKFSVVGINLDDDPKAAADFVKGQGISWPQIHDEGGLESRLAKQLGVFTLPLMMLVDESGAVVNRSITVEELEEQLSKRLRKKR